MADGSAAHYHAAVMAELRAANETASMMVRHPHLRADHRRGAASASASGAGFDALRGLEWPELYQLLLRQRQPDAQCRPLEYGGHDKLAGVIKSIYAPQVRHWLSAFRYECDRFLFLVAEAHVSVGGARAAATLRQLGGFLGVPPIPNAEAIVAMNTHSTTRQNVRSEPMRNATRALLDDFFAPFNAELARLLEQRCAPVPWAPNGGGGQSSAAPSSRAEVPPTAQGGEAAGGGGVAELLSGGVLQLPPRSSPQAARWLQEHGTEKFELRVRIGIDD